MKKLFFILLLLAFTTVKAQIVNIPDPEFKNVLVNWAVVDTNGDGSTDSDVDTNNDGEIQVTEAEAVDNLDIGGNSIASLLGLESFINLESFNLFGTPVTELDVSLMPNLKILKLNFNPITILDVSQNSNLEILNCNSNTLSSLDVSQNPNLIYLNCGVNNIAGDLDLSQNVNLIELYCHGNELASIDITQSVNLEEFNSGGNQLSAIDFTQNVNLINLTCDSNLMTEIDVTQNINLINLSCGFNLLTEIDVSQNVLLESLVISSNQISEINVSANLNLKGLHCSDNIISQIDVSGNPLFKNITCKNNQLTYLNINNGLNTTVYQMHAQGNPNLACIQVDDVAYAYAQPCENFSGWCKDDTAIYSENCILGITEQNLQEVLQLYPNPVKDVLQINTENNVVVKSVQVYNVLGKILLEAKNPNQIDVSVFATGLLFVKIETDRGVVMKKVVKE